MGNPDLLIVFNNGEISFLLMGNMYNTREESIKYGISQWNDFVNYTYKNADNPEELNFEIKSINIYTIH